MKRFLVLGCFGLLLQAASTLLAEERGEPGGTLPEVEGVRLGEAIRLGGPAPGFEIPEEFGGPLALADYRGEKSVILVFYRASW